MTILCIRGEVTDYGSQVHLAKFVYVYDRISKKKVSFVKFQATFLETSHFKTVPKLKKI